MEIKNVVVRNTQFRRQYNTVKKRSMNGTLPELK